MKKLIFAALIIMLICISPLCVTADAGEYIVKFKNNFPAEIYTSELKEVNAEGNIYLIQNKVLIEKLSQYIEKSAPNSVIELTDDIEPIDLYSVEEEELNSDWHTDMIKIKSVWNLKTYGNDVKIAVIDSGCYDHEDLKDNILTGKNYFDNSDDVSDNIGHGTHISGIIAAKMNDIGVTGVAPKTKIVPLKCFDNNESTTVDMLVSAIYDAVNLYKCQIINMSWGMTDNNELIEDAVNYAYENGVILVAAAGNYYSETLYYPAAYSQVVGVGSVEKDKSKSDFSQKNNSVFVVAPGRKILSTFNNGDYKELSGTSQATAMVSGLAAVMLSMDKDITPNKFMQLLISESEDLGSLGYDTEYGYGLVNAECLKNKVLENLKVYISPLCTEGEAAGVYYFNLTDNDQTLSCVKAYYSDTKTTDVIYENVKILAGGSMFCKSETTDKDAQYMAWENFNFINPLGFTRKVYKIW